MASTSSSFTKKVKKQSQQQKDNNHSHQKKKREESSGLGGENAGKAKRVKSKSKKRVREGPTARGARILKRREPQVFEVEKSAMFVRGQNTSEVVRGVLNDLYSLKAPSGVKYSRKNEIYPFEDPSSLEFFSSKSDASLFLFGNHNKKRPNNIIIGRFFDAQVLDMIELGIAAYTPVAEFKDVVKPMIGAKPAIVLRGSAFDTNPAISVLGNLIVDFFRGRVIDSINLAGLEHVIVLNADEGNPTIHLRVYRLVLKKSGTKLPRIELAEIGPRIDWVLRRTQIADKDLRSKAMEIPSQAAARPQKNIGYTETGQKVGQIHMEKQSFDGFQTRKMKALKKQPKKKNASTDSKATPTTTPSSSSSS